MTIDFGTDIACSADTEDADGLFTEITGVPLVVQDLRHRLLTDGVLPSPRGDAWGFDVRTLAGMPAALLAGQQPRIRKVAAADQRIQTVTVTITDDGAYPLRTVTIAVAGMTALGPFRLVFTLASQPDAATAIAVIESQ